MQWNTCRQADSLERTFLFIRSKHTGQKGGCFISTTLFLFQLPLPSELQGFMALVRAKREKREREGVIERETERERERERE